MYAEKASSPMGPEMLFLYSLVQSRALSSVCRMVGMVPSDDSAQVQLLLLNIPDRSGGVVCVFVWGVVDLL